MKRFNTTGLCIPSKHYMVELPDCIEQIADMISDGKYFTINRARQYGKTTTLQAISVRLAEEYHVVSLDFQGISDADFRTEESFVRSLLRMILARGEEYGIPPEICNIMNSMAWNREHESTLSDIFAVFSRWCALSDKPVVMMIDEVDSASNNQVFLDFLSQLRFHYIEREKNPAHRTFQSVILAGVTDIRHIRSKLRDDEQHKLNSPWNIAADFNVDMSLPESGIRKMLDEYQADHGTMMDTAWMAGEIRAYTSGYPFLVSRICQLIDEQMVPARFKDIRDAWSPEGLDEAVKMILTERNSLFDSLAGKLTNYPELRNSLRRILMEGATIPYNSDREEIAQMEMYGFIVQKDNAIAISNRIFETRLYNLFLTDEELQSNSFAREGSYERNIFVKDGKLDVQLILERFIDTYTEIMGPLTDRFHEKDGRELFLLYLKPIINGTGNYYIEAQTRNQTRTDVIIDYLGQRYIIELKIWRGPRYNEAGERQIAEYLDYFKLSTGYMLSFNFNKKKDPGVKKVMITGKTLYEATV